MASEPEISTGTSDASTPLCEWQRTWTGERLCDQPAAYRVVYEDCTVCPGDDCEGAGICVEHAAVERERATEVGLIGIRSVAS